MDSAMLVLGRPQACMGSFLSWQPLNGISSPLSSVQPLSSAHQAHAVHPSLCLHRQHPRRVTGPQQHELCWLSTPDKRSATF